MDCMVRVKPSLQATRQQAEECHSKVGGRLRCYVHDSFKKSTDCAQVSHLRDFANFALADVMVYLDRRTFRFRRQKFWKSLRTRMSSGASASMMSC